VRRSGRQYGQTDLQAAIEILLILKQAEQGFSGCVIGTQDQGGGALCKPRMGGAVQKKKAALEL